MCEVAIMLALLGWALMQAQPALVLASLHFGSNAP